MVLSISVDGEMWLGCVEWNVEGRGREECRRL